MGGSYYPLLLPQYIFLRPMVQTPPGSAPESLSISSLIFLFVQVILLNGNCAGLGAAAVIIIQNQPQYSPSPPHV